MKRAVDTNVLLRMLADNGSEQAARAQALLFESEIHVGSTVLLESEWVLRHHFGISAPSINALFYGLLGMPNVDVQNGALMDAVLKAHRAGMDFADALHLHLAEGDEFLTFDQALRRKATGLSNVPVVREP